MSATTIRSPVERFSSGWARRAQAKVKESPQTRTAIVRVKAAAVPASGSRSISGWRTMIEAKVIDMPVTHTSPAARAAISATRAKRTREAQDRAMATRVRVPHRTMEPPKTTRAPTRSTPRMTKAKARKGVKAE